MILSLDHPAPTMQIRIRWSGDGMGAEAWRTGSATLASPCRWYGDRAANQDILRALRVALSDSPHNLQGLAILSDGRLRWETGDQTLQVDLDHADTLLPPEYLGLAPGATGIVTLVSVATGSVAISPYALPKLWAADQDAAVYHVEQEATEETEQTSLGHLDPVVLRRYELLELEYDLVAVERVRLHRAPAPPGDWATFEQLTLAAAGPPVLNLWWADEVSAQASPESALDIELTGPWQLDPRHIARPLGRSRREDGGPERWRVVLDAETAP